jgi:spore coat protein U-like protein
MFAVKYACRRASAGGRTMLLALVLLGASQVALASNAEAETAHQDKLLINVHGRVPEHCSLGSVGDMAFGDLTQQGIVRTADVALNCNIPFQVSIRSANGGLANEAYPHGQGPYSGLVPYSLAVAIPVRRPSSDILSQSFTSTALMSGGSLTSGGGIALEGMRLTVALAPPTGEAGLLGGRYSETVTITVSPI